MAGKARRIDNVKLRPKTGQELSLLAFPRVLRRLASFGLTLSTSLSLLSLAYAQPDTTPRRFITQPPIPDAPTVTTEQLQTLTGGPTLVTFQGQNVATITIIKALLGAANLSTTRFPITLGEAAPKTLTVNWNQVPFWKAAQEVETLTGMRWGAVLRGEMRLLPASSLSQGGLNGALGAETPFVRIVANSVSKSTRSVINLAAKDAPQVTSDPAQLRLSVCFDPKLQLESARLQSLSFQYLDGPPITLSQQGGALDIQGASSFNSQFTVTLPTAPRTATKLSRISGTLRSSLILNSQLWKIPDLSATPKFTQDVGPDQYTLENIRFLADQILLSVNALKMRPVGVPTDVRRIFTALRIRDTQGRELTIGSISSRSETAPDGRLNLKSDLTFRLRDAQNAVLQGPFSLEWHLPGKTGTLDVPFELRDIPLP